MSRPSNEEIVRAANRALELTEVYQNEAESDGLLPELLAVLKKDPKDALAFATCYETTYMRLDPWQKEEPVHYWDGIVSNAILKYLNDGYEVAYMSPTGHAVLWGELTYYIDMDTLPNGAVQKYLDYCQRNGVTFETVKEAELDLSEDDLPECFKKLCTNNTGASLSVREKDNAKDLTKIPREESPPEGAEKAEAVTEMSKYDFWALIGEAGTHCGQDMDAYAGWLTEQLKELGPRQAQDFHDIFHAYRDLADQYGLWSAASILCNGCTDDGFIDFRAWLIAQGGSVYLAALNDPDSLADVEPYGDCQFESLNYVGHDALEALTGQDAYDRTDPASYDALTVKLEQDIVYAEGIGYPYELNEIAGAFPRLCARYMTPEEISALPKHGSTWNTSLERVREARAAGPKNAPVYRPWAGAAVPPKPIAERDVEKIIAAMKAETFREIQNDSGFPEGQLAWYWSYLGSLDMAQQLGLITDDRRQALYREAEPHKPDCVVTTRTFEPESEENTEMKIGGGMT